MMLLVTEGITQDHLNEVYADPYIARVGHDHRAFAPVIHPCAVYLSAWADGVFCGAFLAIKNSELDLDLHALLKNSAVMVSRELGRSFLAWAFAMPILRVTAHVIQGLDSAKNYCLKLGFKHEGTKRQACMQSGVIKDVYCLGMTRQEWDNK
jgi:hypothetical protein